jgi:AcrR family transcriptional regulator
MHEQQANPPVRRVRRSKSDIVDAALGILDDQGLADLTMRHLADVLGVQPSALYWHFDSKQALLAAVSTRILAPMTRAEVDASSLPRAAFTLGTRLHDCLLCYRDAAELVSSSLALGLIDPPLLGHLSAAARDIGEPDALAATASEAVTHFVLGYAFHEQQRLQADTLGVLGGPPELTPDRATAPVAAGETAFEPVLALIAQGIAAASEAGSQDERSGRGPSASATPAR